MAKLFNTIRRKLLTENRFSKYLLYAIGEIILVVIGILIALSINNWNEKRKISELETRVLTEISEDLADDIRSLQNDVNLNQEGLKSIESIKRALASNQPITDSLALKFGQLAFNTTYTLKFSGYKNLSNLGFQILAEDSIRKTITNLYEMHYSFLKEREKTTKNATYEHLKPKLMTYFKAIKISDDIGDLISPERYYYPKDFEALKTDPDFQLLLDISKETKYFNLFDLQFVMGPIQNTKELIDAYLKEKSNKTE